MPEPDLAFIAQQLADLISEVRLIRDEVRALRSNEITAAPNTPKTIIDTPFDDIGENLPWELIPSARVLHCLKNEADARKAQPWTIGQICQFTESELLRIPNLGRKSLNEIKLILAHYDLKLANRKPLE